MNYLYALEQAKKDQLALDRGQSAFLGSSVHSEPKLKQLRVTSIKEVGNSETLRLLVLRNPYTRTISAWANKFLFAQGDYGILLKYRDSDMAPKDLASLDSLQQSFTAFTSKLETDRDFLFSNGHWQPQLSFIENLTDYNLILETSQLDSLQTQLQKQVGSGLIARVGSMPRFNETKSPITSHLATEESLDHIANAYNQDINAMQGLELNADRPAPQTKPNQTEIQGILQEVESQARQSRAKSEIKLLKGELRAIQQSKSWKLTAWLRWLDSKLTGKPMRSN